MIISKRTLFPMSLILFVLATIAVSCKKGDTGPAGTTGATGPKGTANVYYSAWVAATGIKDSTIDNSAMSVATIASTQLADSILQRGAVLVYLTYGGGVFPLPHTTNAGGKTSTVSFIPQLNRLTITRFTLDNSNAIKLSSVLQFRFVVIPGGTGGRQMDYSAMSYQQVCETFGIPE